MDKDFIHKCSSCGKELLEVAYVERDDVQQETRITCPFCYHSDTLTFNGLSFAKACEGVVITDFKTTEENGITKTKIMLKTK